MIKIESFIDHTLLKPQATELQIKNLCHEAVEYNFKSVCLNPTHIKLAVNLLKDTEVKIGTVCGFPLGASQTGIKVAEAESAENSGAQEIDMVANIGAIKDGNYNKVRDDIAAVRKALVGSTVLKVILECGLLTDTEIRNAATVAADCGVDFVKTSTGFFGETTTAQVNLLYETVGNKISIKAAGGIRDLRSLLAMIEAGASRIGTSSAVQIMREYRSQV